MDVIDFSSRPPDVGEIKNSGLYEGVMIYCSPGRETWMKGKQPPKTYINELKANGLKFAFVWQFKGGTNGFAGSDVVGGYQAGEANARDAQKYLDSIGCSDHPIYFAVDFNITLKQWNDTVVNYFRGASSVLGKQRVGIYGHSRVVAWASQDDVVAKVTDEVVLGWITKSWSGSYTGESYSTLYQYEHNVKGPDNVDIDKNKIRHPEWGWRPLPNTSSKPERETPKVMTSDIRPNPNHRGDPLFLPEVLKAFGVPVNEMKGWTEWGMGDFGEIWGVCVHHTGANNTTAEYIARNPGIYNGLSSQLHLSRVAPYSMTTCGAGLAWHMGLGSYPGLPTNNANPKLIGIEAQSNGVDPWPPEMLDIYVRGVAAILWYLGKNSNYCISHWEYSLIAQGKWDPGAGDGVSGHMMDMNAFRARVQYYIDNPPFSEGVDDLSEALNERFTSRAPGSTYAATLKDFIVNADAHAWVTRVNTEKLLLLMEQQLENEKKRLETDNRLATALESLSEQLRK